MQTNTTQGRALAIAAGCAFTAGGLTILMGDALLRPQDWTTYHVLTVLTVFGTIAAGHLMADAARARQALAVIGFLMLFLAGTALVVYQSVGRQAELTDTKANTAEARNADIATKRADIATARQRLADADKMVEIETRKGGCGTNCKDWKQRAAEVRSHLKTLETEIAALGAPAPVAPKAEKMAAVAALFGANEAKARAALTLIEPFLWTLFFEIGSIVSLGFAFRHRPAGPVSIAGPSEIDTMQTSFAGLAPVSMFSGEQPDPTPPKPGKRAPLQRFPANVVTFSSKHSARKTSDGTSAVLSALASVGGSVASNRELAKLMGVTDGEASKRVAAAGHLLAIEKVGKEVRISLPHDKRSAAIATA